MIAVAKDGTKIDGQVAIINDDRISFTSDKSLSGVKFIVKGKVEVNRDLGQKLIQYTARALMSVRNISLIHSGTDGTVLPGFMPEPQIFGSGRYTPNKNMFSNMAGQTTAPGLLFLLGWQDKDFAERAAGKGWITRDSTLNSPFVMSHSENWNFRADIEPFPDLRIDVNANRTYSERTTEFYNYNNSTGRFDPFNRSVRGNFTMSINTMNTAFSKMGNKEEAPPSKAFENMKSYREIIAKRLSSQRIANDRVVEVPGGYKPNVPDPATGFPIGYGPTSPQVMVPAFIAAYTGQSPDKVALSPFPVAQIHAPQLEDHLRRYGFADRVTEKVREDVEF